MSKFKKLPIEIEATRITEEIVIHTREGTLKGHPGEWLITGIEGEQYPCGDAIFRETYRPTGPDNCSYCIYNEMKKGQRPCDMHETCLFRWKED